MVRYHNFDVVFAEIPGETTLALNITGCPNRCPGCHSPHLQADEGRVLDEAELLGLLARYGRSVTCVAFMGGDAGPHKIARLAGTVRKTCPELRTGGAAGGFRGRGIRLRQTGRMGRGAGSADGADDQPAALPGRTGRDDGGHHEAVPAQAVTRRRFAGGSRKFRD